ncbi:hypothetical protein SHIRM173S_02036 [Streptomyces hirsutus]
MKFRKRTLASLGDPVCENLGSDDPGSSSKPKYFPCRSGMCITEFFAALGANRAHDGSPRHRRVADVLEATPAESHGGPARPPESFRRLIDHHRMSPADALTTGPDRPTALRQLDQALVREGFEAFYAADGHCCLRRLGTKTVSALAAQPHRPVTAAEVHRRADLAAYLDGCSEDEFIEKALLPLSAGLRLLGQLRTWDWWCRCGEPPRMRGDHVSNMIQLFWNWIGRTQEEIEQARRDWMEGTRFGEVKGYDGAPLPAPELPPVPLKPRGRVR